MVCKCCGMPPSVECWNPVEQLCEACHVMILDGLTGEEARQMVLLHSPIADKPHDNPGGARFPQVIIDFLKSIGFEEPGGSDVR